MLKCAEPIHFGMQLSFKISSNSVIFMDRDLNFGHNVHFQICNQSYLRHRAQFLIIQPPFFKFSYFRS